MKGSKKTHPLTYIAFSQQHLRFQLLLSSLDFLSKRIPDRQKILIRFKMAYTFGPHREIEEIDLTDVTVSRRSRNQVRVLKLPPYQRPQRLTLMKQISQFSAQLCGPDRPLSRKNKTAIWQHIQNNPSEAMKQRSTSTLCHNLVPCPEKESQIDQDSARFKKQQWTEPHSFPAAEAINECGDMSLSLQALEHVKESLSRGDAAVKGMYEDLRCAGKTLDLVVAGTAPHSRDPEVLAAAMRIIFKNLAVYLRRMEKSQQESRQEIESLGLSVRSLVRLF